MHAWLALGRSHPAVHPQHAGAVGYCLGGQAVLEQVRAGHDVQAGVLFHGLLHSRPYSTQRKGGDRMSAEEFANDQSIVKAPNAHATKCSLLVEHGELDAAHCPPESFAEFEEEMSVAGVDWKVNVHADAPHGFALAPGVWATAYHEEADRQSTISMLKLFARTWPEFPQSQMKTNACGTILGLWSSESADVASKL